MQYSQKTLRRMWFWVLIIFCKQITILWKAKLLNLKISSFLYSPHLFYVLNGLKYFMNKCIVYVSYSDTLCIPLHFASRHSPSFRHLSSINFNHICTLFVWPCVKQISETINNQPFCLHIAFQLNWIISIPKVNSCYINELIYKWVLECLQADMINSLFVRNVHIDELFYNLLTVCALNAFYSLLVLVLQSFNFSLIHSMNRLTFFLDGCDWNYCTTIQSDESTSFATDVFNIINLVFLY